MIHDVQCESINAKKKMNRRSRKSESIGPAVLFMAFTFPPDWYRFNYTALSRWSCKWRLGCFSSKRVAIVFRRRINKTPSSSHLSGYNRPLFRAIILSSRVGLVGLSCRSEMSDMTVSLNLSHECHHVMPVCRISLSRQSLWLLFVLWYEYYIILLYIHLYVHIYIYIYIYIHIYI